MNTNTYIAILSAASALLGTIIGGIISYFTTRYTIINQHKHNQQTREIDKREVLYSEFLAEATRLELLTAEIEDGNEKTMLQPGQFSQIYYLSTRIRLIASSELFSAAAAIVTKLADEHFQEPQQNKQESKPEAIFVELAKKDLEQLKRKA